VHAGGAKRVPVSADEPTLVIERERTDRGDDVQFAMPATPAARFGPSATPGEFGATPTLDRCMRPHQQATSVSGTPTTTIGTLDAANR
jgi:hypothetical protein